MPGTDPHSTIETIWRMEAPKLIAGLTRLVRDVGRAADLAHDALLAAQTADLNCMHHSGDR